MIEPYYQDERVTLYCSDCRDVMREMEPGSVDAVITDPPYGCGKAEWDDSFPTEWYEIACKLAPMVCIITGSCGAKDSISLVGDRFIDIVAARNLNALTRGPLGFNNWLACVVSGRKPKGQHPNFFEFAVRGAMPPHPSPKPIEYMFKLTNTLTNDSDTVLDPFMGSGTTGVACVKTGRRFIGVEISPEYCEIAKRRIVEAEQQLTLMEVS